MVVLLLGSAPMASEVSGWDRTPFSQVVAINNAWRLRPDWDVAIYPWDFPEERRPMPAAGQRLVTEDDFVPAQNAYGGFVYAGATMAYTAAYWVLYSLRPKVIAMFGCDMHYPKSGVTHFYGHGTADPLREDITLRSLEAKSARLMALAARQGCAMVNLSSGPSRLVFPRVSRASVAQARPQAYPSGTVEEALGAEAALGYLVPSGRYWEEAERFDPLALDRIDALWLRAVQPDLQQTA